MFGKNLKVHFAGAEQVFGFECAMAAGVRYSLFTVFPFISEKFKIKGFPPIGLADRSLWLDKIKENIARQNNTIMDSGLFTLMFGAHAGKRDRPFIEKWCESLADFVNSNRLNVICVEVDCQKVLGVNEAWEIRQKLRSLLPSNRIINVFHMEDGKKGLDRIIEYADYMAISVPEMRLVYGIGKKYEDAVIRYANYIKNRKPDIDIHLLGCTSARLLKECNFCTSSDSTSWNCVSRYFQLKNNGKSYHSSKISDKAIQEADAILRPRMEARGYKYIKTTAVPLYVSAKIALRDYARYAGDQT